ncbi:MAG: TonB-dependent siderophore receptor [Phenylobacterium sp.]|uniref:TonB-dependent siderophore receptor n=1 Tax=Phenylobacterium sp. TaxID=1871053 RepID=UPI00271A0C65|nr:TonB-dependent siderophore receptor [Phenylobacterium sp.]MDO8902527.1 TonB-dependent siderophore receptor [Phenylobacterium sp.]
MFRTGLFIGAGLFTLATASGSQAADDVASVAELLVTARPVENYSAADTVTGLRFPVLLDDLPLSVSVVPQELIEDRGITQLGEALDNVSGAQRKMGYGGTQNFGAFIRGFDQSFLTLRNGLRDPGFYTLRDIANVERFEVLKGPASILYGAVNPGGITNTVTKQPTPDSFGRVRALVGSFERYRGEVDLGGALGDRAAFRLNGAYEDNGSYRDEVTSSSKFLAPVVAFNIAERTKLTLEAEYKQSEFVWDLGLPRSPVSFAVPIERFLGEANGVNDVQSIFTSATLEHAFSDALRLRAVLGHSETDGDYNLRSPLAITNGRTVSRVAYATDEKSMVDNLQVDLLVAFETGQLQHKLTVGVEQYRTKQAYDFLLQPLASIDLFAPVYGARPEPGFRLFADQLNADAKALYIQDFIKIGSRWNILAGVRYDQVDNRSVNLMTGALVRDSRDDAISPQIGVVYQPSDATSLYASYGRSFVPITSGRTLGGENLEPETGEQVEVGVKQDLLGGKAKVSVALYEIRKENVSTPDPTNPMFRVQTGEQRSRGVELDVSGELTPGWDLIASASWIDAEVSKDNRIAVGSKLPGAAEWSASVWTKYEFLEGPLTGWAVGAGAYYVDDRQAALPNNAWTLPSYTRVDVMAAYDFGDVELQLNIRNLGDEKIYDLTGTTILPQEPRAATLRATYSF